MLTVLQSPSQFYRDNHGGAAALQRISRTHHKTFLLAFDVQQDIYRNAGRAAVASTKHLARTSFTTSVGPHYWNSITKVMDLCQGLVGLLGPGTTEAGSTKKIPATQLYWYKAIVPTTISLHKPSEIKGTSSLLQ